MTPKQKNRLFIVLSIIIGVSIAAALGLTAFKENIRFFINLEDVESIESNSTNQYRIAGLVKPGSVKKQSDNVSVQFTLTDCKADVDVFYTGILPDLFREGQTIVANGTFDTNKRMTASEVLAKHDENYVPSEAAESLMEEQANICIDQLKTDQPKNQALKQNSSTGGSAPLEAKSTQTSTY